MSGGIIGVDLDGTLAHYDRWRGPDHIGAPMEPIEHERQVSTARGEDSYPAIRAWCLRHLHRELPVTNVKDRGFVEIWDDRAVQVIPNTGRRADGTE